MRRTAPIIGVTVVVALAMVVGFAAFRRRSADLPSPSPTGPAPSLPIAQDIEIAMYQGQVKAGGEKIELSSLWKKTHLPVVLNFWAGLCPPCRAEMPDFQRLEDWMAPPSRRMVR